MDENSAIPPAIIGKPLNLSQTEWEELCKRAEDARGGVGVTICAGIAQSPAQDSPRTPHFPPYPIAEKLPEILHQSKEHPITIKPIKTPEIMTALRLRHKTHFGHLHVSITIDVKADREYEIFAQLGKAGDLAASELEGMCRLASLHLRAGGVLKDVAKQLVGIGSILSSNNEEKVSIANSLGEALARYLDFKKKYGLQALLLGEIEIPGE